MRWTIVAFLMLTASLCGCPSDSQQPGASKRLSTIVAGGMVFLWSDPENAALLHPDRRGTVAAVASQGAACDVLERLMLAGSRIYKVRARGRWVVAPGLQGEDFKAAFHVSWSLTHDDLGLSAPEKRAMQDRWESSPEASVEGWTAYVSGE